MSTSATLPPHSRRPGKPKHRLRRLRWLAWPFEALALAAFWGVCGLLPVARASALGAHVMRRIGPRLGRHWRIRNNLAIAFPEAGPARIDELARAVWGNFGATLAEYAHLGRIARDRFEEHVELVVDPAIETRLRARQPVIFLTAHLANWELAGAAATPFGAPLVGVYGPQNNPLTEWLLQRRRRALGSTFVGNDAGVGPLLRALRAGQSLGLLVDVKVPGGAFLPFFGKPTSTTLVPARLALKLGCPLVPVRVERLAGVRFRLTAHAPIPPPDDVIDVEGRAAAMMTRFNALLADWIRERPGDWGCFQRRWKHRPVPAGVAPLVPVQDRAPRLRPERDTGRPAA